VAPHYAAVPDQLHFFINMNKPFQLTVVDQIQAAEKRHYIALQKYDKALRNMTPPENLDLLKKEVCEAFAALTAAHDQFINCGETLQAANS
jgi:hypothetical protein